MLDEWVKSQEANFGSAEALVDDEAIANPIQRERIDIAVKMIGGPNLKVLDVGCSGGGISQLIHDNGNECWGIDLPAVLARIPEERRSWLQVFSGDASKKPWAGYSDFPVASTTSGTLGSMRSGPVIPDGTFDVVFAGEIIEHMINIEPFLTEAWRVLKPGGRLVLTTPNQARALNRVALLFGHVHTWHEWEHIPHHVRYFTPETLQAAVSKYGFKPLRLEFGRSEAEGSDLGFSVSWLDPLSPSERSTLINMINRLCPDGWKHSFIILESQKIGGESK